MKSRMDGILSNAFKHLLKRAHYFSPRSLTTLNFIAKFHNGEPSLHSWNNFHLVKFPSSALHYIFANFILWAD
jgi:hypothetical protein